MSNDLTRFSASPDRHLPRPVQRAAAQLDAEAALQARRLQNIGFITQIGLFSVAGLTKTQLELQQLVPEAALRLAAVADAGFGAIAMSVVGLGVQGRMAGQ